MLEGNGVIFAKPIHDYWSLGVSVIKIIIDKILSFAVPECTPTPWVQLET